jgi:hypothetical protein
VAFDVVSFLSSKRLIKLKPDEQQQFWQTLLGEYSQLLQVTGGENEELNGMLSAGKPLGESEVRRALSVWPIHRNSNAATSSKETDTVTTLYAATIGR